MQRPVAFVITWIQLESDGSKMTTYQRITRYFRRSGSEIGILVSEAPGRAATAVVAECTCPDFCERDHDNE